MRFLQPRPDGSPGGKVHEVSPVLLAAGRGTRTLAAKRQRADEAANEAGLQEFLRFVAIQAGVPAPIDIDQEHLRFIRSQVEGG